ncbi:zinc finger protein 518A isoform X1 [Gadus chalcogrammus]|uniref:zinc finger protein 518A isoform X1 n=2 Tax=Gadus chalcogrammus TaxID=1042646 RepID=UPI0024C4BAFD|nr:zinc finger protein 518A isoform X1 [Gadus chalcogrammus]
MASQPMTHSLPPAAHRDFPEPSVSLVVADRSSTRMRLSWPRSLTCESEEEKKDSCSGEAMEQDLSTADHPSLNDNTSKTEEESNEMKDFVYKHLRVVTEQSNGTLQCKPDDYAIEETSTRKTLKVIRKSRKNTQGAVFTGNILSFSCSVCKDDFTYSPNDLLKHFKKSHKDSLPSYPCDLCSFVTNEFPDLQRHRIGHRNTLVTCEICNNKVQYSLLMLTRHYIMCHSLNGRFQCEKCEFKTLDAGTFVQHIHHHNEGRFKCLKCPHVSLNKDEYQRHLNVHASKLSFNCPICGYVSERIDFFKNHMNNTHGEVTEDWINGPRAQEDEATANSSAAIKLKEDSRSSRRLSKRNCVSGKLTKDVHLLKPEKSSEETLQFDKLAAKKNKNGSKSHNATEQQAASESKPPIQLIMPDCGNSLETSQNNPNGLVIKLKNKISIPPNCTTKVIGFKVVDGKKHLVLKVLPASKVELPTEDHSQTKDFVGNIRTCNSEGLTNPRCTSSQNISASTHVFQDDIVAVKVKVEEEEIPLIGLTPAVQEDECREQAEIEQNGSPKYFAQSSTILTMENKMDHPKEKNDINSNSIPVKTNPNLTSLSKSKIHNVRPLLTSIEVDLPTDIHERLLDTATNSLVTESSENHRDFSTSGEIISFQIGSKHDLTKGDQNCTQKTLTCAMPLPEMHSSSASYSMEHAMSGKNSLINTPNEKVFSFHNYSKESSDISPHSPNFDSWTEIPTESFAHESSQVSLQLAQTPKPSSKSGHGSNANPGTNGPPHHGLNESMPEVDTDHGQGKMYAEEQTTEETPESIFQDFNIIKVEEDYIPVSNPQQESNSLGHPCHDKSILIVKQHSDAIINHQLNKEKNKERLGTCPDSIESGKQAKTTLRFFQIPEGKQQMLLQTAENKYAIPVPLKGNRSFKLITKSNSPRINVSYMKPGFEFSSNPTGLVPAKTGREVGMEKPLLRTSKTGITSVSAVPPNVGTISNHYLLNSTGFNGPVLVSKTGHGTPVDRPSAGKTQQTCYLVKRSLQVAKPPNNVGFTLASSQVPLSSCQMLAMPLNPAIKSNILPDGRQAYLVRYVAQAKSGKNSSNLESQTWTQAKKNGESIGSKVLYRIVTPTSGLFAGIVPTANEEPLFLAPRSQSDQSKKNNDMAFTCVKSIFPVQRLSAEHDFVSGIFQSQSNLENPWPIRPPSQRKRRRKALFDELPMHKARRLANKTLTTEVCHPLSKDIERKLRLYPFSSLQQIKCPRRHQPVVVLNHPDADIPEVASIMKSVNRYRGAVTKVSLSHQTVEALSVHNQMGLTGKKPIAKCLPPASNGSRLQLDRSSVRERFLLKLKLKKKGRRKYEVVKTLSSCGGKPIFDCWFCGRLFHSQEDWIGHGQRHLMEATRDWNKLF